MFKKNILLLLWVAPFAAYIAFYLFNFPMLSSELTAFGDNVENLFLWGCLSLLVVIALWPSKPDATETDKASGSPIRFFMGVFHVMMFSLLVASVYINPHGRFPWRTFPFTTTAAHYQKIALYEQRAFDPEVVVLGSSHTYTISASYLTEVTGRPAFNMAVGSAGPIDEVTLARYLIENTPNTPRVFLVEMVAPDLGTGAWKNSMPLTLIPYLPAESVGPVLKSIFRDTLSMRSLTDAAFLLANQDTKEYITFLPDGTGVRSPKMGQPYWRNVKKQTPRVFKQNRCTALDEDGMNAFEELVALSEEHKVSLVFYRSPLNAEFFEGVNLNNPLYKNCQMLLADYMQSIVDNHPNVFYVDLLDYEPVSSLREKGYIDVQHLTPGASNLVIDALLSTINDGLAWVSKARGQ